MRHFLLVACALLTGCSGESQDLQLFVDDVKQQHQPSIPALDATPEFQVVEYQVQSLRSPFVPPSRELTQEVIDIQKDCLQPNLARNKSRLESYALDNLVMRGSIKDEKSILALVQSTDGNVYPVGMGDYLGLYYGRVVGVSEHKIEIIELIPDGSGCWTERTSNMELANKE